MYKIKLSVATARPRPEKKYSLTPTPLRVLGYPSIMISTYTVKCLKCMRNQIFYNYADTDKEIDAFISRHARCMNDWERRFINDTSTPDSSD